MLEGLTLREAVQWCGGEEQLNMREATRLRKVGTEPAEAVGETTQNNPEGDEGADAGRDGPEAGAGRGESL